MDEPRLLDIHEVCAVTGLSRGAIEQRIRKGKFPEADTVVPARGAKGYSLRWYASSLPVDVPDEIEMPVDEKFARGLWDPPSRT